jgi:hypothetical protein
MMLKYIEDCIKIASNCDGKVFGGYVRDLINQNNFKDVDIWFKNQTQADLFINQVKSKYIFNIVDSFTIKNNMHYTFDRIQYHLFIGDIVWFDIVISDILPVDDFYINCLLYYYKNDVDVLESATSRYDKDTLINFIKNKDATMLLSYTNKLINEITYPVHFGRIHRIFLNNNWIVRYNDIIFKSRFTRENQYRILLMQTSLYKNLDIDIFNLIIKYTNWLSS